MNSSTGIPLRTWTFLKTMSDICGFWSGPAWPAAVTRPSRNTVIVSMALLLLGKARRLGSACDKQRLVGGLCLGDSRQRAPRLHDLAGVTFKDHFLAREEILRSPTLSADRVRAGQLQVPIGHVTLGIGDIDVHAHMRIQPFDLRHYAGQLDLLVRVIFGIESMVGDDRNHQAEKADAGD